jgi:hypothetical protein
MLKLILQILALALYTFAWGFLWAKAMDREEEISNRSK